MASISHIAACSANAVLPTRQNSIQTCLCPDVAAVIVQVSCTVHCTFVCGVRHDLSTGGTEVNANSITLNTEINQFLFPNERKVYIEASSTSIAVNIPYS